MSSKLGTESSNFCIECPACKGKVSINANVCPKCGQPLDDDIKNKIKSINDRKETRKGCIVITIAMIIIIGLFLEECNDSEKDRADLEGLTLPRGFISMSAQKMNFEKAKKYCDGKKGRLIQVQYTDQLHPGWHMKDYSELHTQGYGYVIPRQPGIMEDNDIDVWTGTESNPQQTLFIRLRNGKPLWIGNGGKNIEMYAICVQKNI